MSYMDPPGVTKKTADATYPPKASLVGGLGDFSPDGMYIIACGDSTTEQFNQNQGGSQMIQALRLPGEVWDKIAGFINFGGSGYTLRGFVEDPIGTVPTIPPTGVGAISTWDTYGHKPTGAISLATALAWRAGKGDRAIWRICYGINDMILYAATGNLSQTAITAYLVPYLQTVINRIVAAYPHDSIIMECPNPMTARPFTPPGQGFPSYTAYPTFGNDLATDAALVEKWNQAARAAYLQIQNQYPKVKFNDSWQQVFGPSQTSLIASSQLPFLVNLVHPTGTADMARIRSISRITNPKPISSEGRIAEADAQATAMTVNPWEVFPGYFRDNPRYRLGANTTFVGAGSNYLDLGITYAQFLQQVSGTVYVAVGDLTAQAFSSYTPVASGNNTRLTGVVPSAALQAAVSRQSVQLYLDNINQLVANDSYVNAAAVAAKEYVTCNGLSGGSGYIDFSIPKTVGRISSKFANGLKGGTLVIGGSINATLSLATATAINRAGTTSQRAIRINIAGDYSTYGGQPAAITFDDSAPSPKVWERVVIPTAVLTMTTTGDRRFLSSDVPMLDGVTFTANLLGAAIAAILTIEIYALTFGARTLIGTISIPSNGSSATLSSGNPTTVAAGAVYEAVYTGASNSAVNAIKITAVPV